MSLGKPSLVKCYAAAARRGDFGIENKWIGDLLSSNAHYAARAVYRHHATGRSKRAEWHHHETPLDPKD